MLWGAWVAPGRLLAALRSEGCPLDGTSLWMPELGQSCEKAVAVRPSGYEGRRIGKSKAGSEFETWSVTQTVDGRGTTGRRTSCNQPSTITHTHTPNTRTQFRSQRLKHTRGARHNSGKGRQKTSKSGPPSILACIHT